MIGSLRIKLLMQTIITAICGWLRLTLIVVSLGSVGLPLSTALGTTLPTAWDATIDPSSTNAPRFIAVDKQRQELLIYSNSKKLDLNQKFICTTGQKPGDKQEQGDLKTPEGIYFIVRHLNSGLDYVMYGNEAYTLNYPNPVDKLRRKTGYGIWIHGRGEAISPLITQGCVAMNNNDLADIGSFLTPGTPVALAGSFDVGVYQEKNAATAQMLRQKATDWAKAWSQRSTQFFSFYDKEAYSIANEPFTKFQAQKERLFKALPWIKTSVSDVQVFPGPGYWVTWFHQQYEAPNLSTEGVRRLYWQEDKKGGWKIVGMEWAPGLTIGSAVDTAEPAVPPVDVIPLSEEQAQPLQADASSVPGLSPQQEAGVQKAEQTPAADKVSGSNQTASEHGTADRAEQHFARPDRALALVESKLLPIPAPITPPPPAVSAQPDLSQTQGAENTVSGLGLPPAIPAQGIGVPASPAPSTAVPPPPVTLSVQQPSSRILDQTQQEPATAVAEVTPDTPPAEPAPSAVVVAEAPQRTAPSTQTQVQPSPDPQQQQTSEPSVPESDLVAVAQTAIALTIEEWRVAWETGNLAHYLEFYVQQARQGGRSHQNAIKRHKEGLWKTKAPAEVIFENMEITVSGHSASVTMKQKYADVSGNSDVGIKKLTLEHIDDMWFIVTEDWSPTQ